MFPHTPPRLEEGTGLVAVSVVTGKPEVPEKLTVFGFLDGGEPRKYSAEQYKESTAGETGPAPVAGPGPRG